MRRDLNLTAARANRDEHAPNRPSGEHHDGKHHILNAHIDIQQNNLR